MIKKFEVFQDGQFCVLIHFSRFKFAVCSGEKSTQIRMSKLFQMIKVLFFFSVP